MSGFDRLAKPYRWMEYLSFGVALERCRCRYLMALTKTRHALLLGDGDGRFAAQLLRQAPHATLLAVDGSAAMLAVLQNRCMETGLGSRVTVQCTDLTAGLPVPPAGIQFDLLATHFFLDCLSASEIERLACGLKPMLTADARWIVSEFHVPRNGFRLPARMLIWSLYLAFGVLTGLRTKRIPPYADILQKAGFQREERAYLLGGILVSEVWTVRPGHTCNPGSLESGDL